MVEENDFEEIINTLVNKNTLDRAEIISSNCVRILKIDTEIGLIEAEIQGNKIVPYKLVINQIHYDSGVLYNFKLSWNETLLVYR